ncbi:MAG: hypothetical protein NZ929_00855 [Aigarchaeota archaeon]|nr:hypothetical protein [Aigarchaeota archaeon]MDW7986187.1 hypothetical protein [Nitrososphaerota archaeon]
MKKEVDLFIGYSNIASVEDLLDIEDLDKRELCIKMVGVRR